jgi:3-hydroxyacyl-CoA dehydrogenase/enoyl-CoA hydratase/3-hydroxybutyryl-CoA epimerase
MLAIAPAMLTAKTRGCYPAPKAILACAVEGAQVGFEQASRIESRYFVELACGQVSKNMIGAFWHQHNAIKRGASRPQGYPRGKIERVGILGAGLMGAGIACACAVRGLQVVLKDVDAERAAQGKAYTARVLDKRVAQGRMSESERDAVLARILPTGSVSDLADCELVIEAVFEDQALKARVTAETEAQLSATALFASNTSTLPISGLARASSRPTQFIGLHFFSPADKMPLVEIICGEQTDPATLARAYDFVLQIGKTPIVVGDSRGFFTSRVFGAYNREGIGLVGEGAGAARIENLALQSGFPVGPLAVVDEVGLPLARRIREQTEAALRAAAQPVPEYLANQVVDDLLDAGRTGKAGRAGFYDYPPNAPKHLWPDLALRYPAPAEPIPDADVRDRMLYIQPIESVRCLDEGVLRTVRDGNIGSIFGIGFPGWTGGVLQFINHVGLNEFIERADELADHYGERFRVPESLREKARRGEQYADQG